MTLHITGLEPYIRYSSARHRSSSGGATCVGTNAPVEMFSASSCTHLSIQLRRINWEKVSVALRRLSGILLGCPLHKRCHAMRNLQNCRLWLHQPFLNCLETITSCTEALPCLRKMGRTVAEAEAFCHQLSRDDPMSGSTLSNPQSRVSALCQPVVVRKWLALEFGTPNSIRMEESS